MAAFTYVRVRHCTYKPDALTCSVTAFLSLFLTLSAKFPDPIRAGAGQGSTDGVLPAGLPESRRIFPESCSCCSVGLVRLIVERIIVSLGSLRPG